MSKPVVGTHAIRLTERFLAAKSLLVIHGLLSDSECDRVNVRIDTWALRHGLQRKGRLR